MPCMLMSGNRNDTVYRRVFVQNTSGFTVIETEMEKYL